MGDFFKKMTDILKAKKINRAVKNQGLISLTVL